MKAIPESPHTPDALLAALPAAAPGRLLILSGPRGCGKSTWCAELAEKALARGLSVAGLLSPAILAGKQKTAIDLLDLASDQRRRLATRREADPGDSQRSRWQFDQDVFDWGNAALEAIEDCQLLILDELGPLELRHASGLVQGLALLNARRYGAACAVVRPALLSLARQRWPWTEVWQLERSQP